MSDLNLLEGNLNIVVAFCIYRFVASVGSTPWGGDITLRLSQDTLSVCPGFSARGVCLVGEVLLRTPHIS